MPKLQLVMLVKINCQFVIIFSIRLMLTKKSKKIKKIKTDNITNFKTRKFFYQGEHFKRKA